MYSSTFLTLSLVDQPRRCTTQFASTGWHKPLLASIVLDKSRFRRPLGNGNNVIWFGTDTCSSFFFGGVRKNQAFTERSDATPMLNT